MAKFIEELHQGSNVWASWRNNFIGGSDASLIAAYFLDGCDWPYGNWAGAELYKLWCLKTRRIIPKDRPWQEYDGDPRVHGRKTEDTARDWYCLETGDVAMPICVEHEEIPYLAASLDGWTGERAIEIKCPTEPKGHNEAKEGKIPDQYYAQCQHNLFVAGCEKLDYVSFYKGEGIIVEVKRDEPFLAALRTGEDTFWSWVTESKFGAFPPAGEYEIDEISAVEYQEFGQLIAAYFETQTAKRELDAREREIRLGLMRQMPRTKVTGFGATVSLRVQKATEVAAFVKDEFLKIEVRRA